MSRIKNERLNIALEVFPLSEDSLTGIGNVAKQLVDTLQKIDKVNNYILYFKDGNKHISIENKRWKTLFSNRNRFVCKKKEFLAQFRISGSKKVQIQYLLLWFICKLIHVIYSLFIPFHLWLNKIDIFIGFSPDYYPYFFLNRQIKRSQFLYDLVWKFYPETMSITDRLKIKTFVGYNVKRTDFLLSISDSTKNDFMKIFDYPGIINTVPLAADKKIFYPASDTEIERIRMKYNIQKDYIISVGTLEPRKNIETLLKAFSLLNNSSIQLVHVGKVGWIDSRFFDLFDKYNIRDKVIITGYVPVEDLAPLYRGAEVFVFPTLYEGFGLPVLEAMRCGCPVIASNNSSIPEVAGDAALLFEAKNVEELVSHINNVISDSQLRSELRQKGLARAIEFSWLKSAETLLAIIHEECSCIKMQESNDFVAAGDAYSSKVRI